MIMEAQQNLLIELRQSNIEKCVRHLYEHYFERVIAQVCSNGGNWEDGADIFQETILVLIEKIKTGQFRGESSLSTW